MPVLENARYELFCQAMANGEKQDDAYAHAGFKKNRGNSSTLKHKPEVQSRITELLQERSDAIRDKITEIVEVNRDTLLAELEEARQLAILHKNASAAAMATIGKARISGLIIDRREVGEAGAFDGLTDRELVDEAAKRARALGVAGPKLVDDDEEQSGKEDAVG